MKAKEILVALVACVVTVAIAQSCRTVREKTSEQQLDIDSVAISMRHDLAWMLEQGVVEVHLRVDSPTVKVTWDSGGAQKKMVSAHQAHLHISKRQERAMAAIAESRDSTLTTKSEALTTKSEALTTSSSTEGEAGADIRKTLAWLTALVSVSVSVLAVAHLLRRQK